jgi:hypothetical protein
VADAWIVAGSLSTPRASHTATLLSSGKVLVAGGNNGSPVATAELYDSATNAWSSAGTLGIARYQHSATLLPSGKVLVAGGYSPPQSTAELYDPVANSWSPTGSLSLPRYMHTATLLASGQVLVVDGLPGSALYSAERYNPATGTWTTVGSPEISRYAQTAVLLPDGEVLIVSGFNNATVERYDPVSNVWSYTGNLLTARSMHTATLLPSGRVLVVGGNEYGSGTLASAELFDPHRTPDPARQPNLDAANGYLFQTSAFAASGSGFRPFAEGGGGAYNGSATNIPVFQLQRIDSDQTRVIANDESVAVTDTNFTGSATALAGFPLGPALVRTWVNGIPSQALYTTVVSQPPTTTALTTSCMTTFVENQSFTMTATVTGSSPTGTLMFIQATTSLCGNVSLSGGAAMCTTSALAVTGADTSDEIKLIANYKGDANNMASGSPELRVTVLNASDVVFRANLETAISGCPLM